MIRDILSLAPWWFWVFVAPELIVTAIMVVVGVLCVVGGSIAALFTRDTPDVADA
jgi:hypothetical protein